jgi:hypothetical protein
MITEEERVQTMAHGAIVEAKVAVRYLQDKYAAATTDHFAVPKHMLQELEEKIHAAEVWLLHLFPHLRAQQEVQTQPAAEAPASPVTVTHVAGNAQPGGQAATANETTRTPGPDGEPAGASSPQV